MNEIYLKNPEQRLEIEKKAKKYPVYVPNTLENGVAKFNNLKIASESSKIEINNSCDKLKKSDKNELESEGSIGKTEE